MYFPLNLKTWLQAGWYVAIRAMINYSSSVTFKQLTNRCDRRNGIRNVNERYYTAVNQHWTIVPLLENVVAQLPQKNYPIFCSNFYVKTYLKRVLENQKSMICIFGSGQPWITYVDVDDPGQMRSFTWNYVSGSRSAFNSSVASFFVWPVIGAIAVIHGLPDFARKRVRHEFGSRWPDESIHVRWWGSHNPTIWFMEAEPVKSWISLRACFYGRVSSIQKKLFTPIVFLWAIEF